MINREFKLFHRNRMVGVVSNLFYEFPWFTGDIALNENIKHYRPFFEHMAKEDSLNGEFPDIENLWDDWWIDEDGVRREAGMVHIDLDDNSVSYRMPGIVYYSVFVRSKRKNIETLQKEFDDPLIIDVTSKAAEPWVRLSPFYPHGGIPIPFSEGETGQSIEGIWQGLKVFEKCGIDQSKFHNKSMRGLKRSARTNGKVLGHQAGLHTNELLSYLDARKKIYLPCYGWVLDKEKALIDELKSAAETRQLVLLDYETNPYVTELSKPLSHASLIRDYIKGNFDLNF